MKECSPRFYRVSGLFGESKAWIPFRVPFGGLGCCAFLVPRGLIRSHSLKGSYGPCSGSRCQLWFRINGSRYHVHSATDLGPPIKINPTGNFGPTLIMAPVIVLIIDLFVPIGDAVPVVKIGSADNSGLENNFDPA